VICQLRVTLPRDLWSSVISRKHPEAIFDLTDRMEWSKGKTLAVVRVYDKGSWNIAEELRALGDVYHVEEWPTGTPTKEFHVIHKTPPFSRIFSQLGILQRNPIRFKNGTSTWVIVGTDVRIKRLLTSLRRFPLGVSLDPMYRTSDSVMPAQPATPANRLVTQASEGQQPAHLVVCRVRLAFPPPYWDSGMVSRHPDIRIDVLAHSFTENAMLVDLRVHTDDLQTWIDEMRAAEGVIDVKPLGRAQKASTVRVVFKKHDFFVLLNELHVILRTPATIKDGYSEVIMVGPDESIKRLIKMFPPPQLQVEAVYENEREDVAILTPRQTDIFHKAMAAGYFDVPRRVTLTELAARVGVAVSSLSEMLAVVEKKLLQDPRTVGSV